MSLFLKECGGVMRSILYIVYVGAIALFFFTQFAGGVGEDIAERDSTEPSYHSTPLKIPQPGQDSYGSDPAEIPEQVMPNVTQELIQQHASNRYPTYPAGFIRVARLGDADQAAVEAIIERVTGLTVEGLDAYMAKWYEDNTVHIEGGGSMINPYADATGAFPIVVDYETFKTLMAEVDGMLGGGSSFDPAEFVYMGSVPLTYEQALERYDQLINEDRLTGAYARVFSDYMGIAVGIFAVFVPVGFLMRDRRAGMQELVFSRKCSSARLILTRYAACVAAILLPLVILAVIPTVQLMVFAAGQGIAADPLAFLWYILGWVGPTALVACSVGFFCTTLTGTPLGIAVQFLWSYFSLMSSSLTGYGSNLILRHNQTGGWHIMDAHWGELVANRLAYTALALVLLACSILFYELQRRGRLDIRGALGKIFRRRKNAVPADAAA